MKRRTSYLLTLGSFIFVACRAPAIERLTFVYNDFDISMQTMHYDMDQIYQYTAEKVGIDGRHLLDFFRQLYQQNNPRRLRRTEASKIPKIVHQIWIGAQVPPEFNKFIKSWLLSHPDWQYKLWTQHDIAGLHLENEQLLAQTGNPGEMSDIMRYEILYKFGGVYVDMDFENLHPLDELNDLYDFYIGIQPLDSTMIQLGIGLIGSVPGHPMLKQAITQIQKNWQKISKHDVVHRTGPIFFTKIFFEYAGKNNLIDIAFPASYFYPLGCTQYHCNEDEWQEKGAYAVHHWAKSWLLPSFRREQFKTIKNC